MKKLLFLLLAFLLIIPATAQDFTTHQEIQLVPFIVNQLDIQGLRPRGWHEQGNGIYLRARDAVDLTALLLQSREGSPAELLTAMQAEFQLETAPELLENQTTDYFEWSIYRFQRQQSNQTLLVDAAVAENSETGRVYYVLLQTTELFYEELHTNLFLPALQAIAPIQRYLDPAGRFDVPIPSGWLLEEAEDYGVLKSADESIVMYVSATEATDAPAALQAFWTEVHPDFALTFDPANDIITINDPNRIAGLEVVYIVNWQYGTDEEGHIKQGVARVYDGVIYMTLIETTVAVVREFDEAISLIDNNYRITALLPEATPEVTQAP